MGCSASRSSPAPVVIDLSAWNLWADLDLQDELDMMHLAQLLDALEDFVPDQAEGGDAGGSGGPALHKQRSAKAAKNPALTKGTLRLDSIHLDTSTFFHFSAASSAAAGSVGAAVDAERLRANYAAMLAAGSGADGGRDGDGDGDGNGGDGGDGNGSAVAYSPLSPTCAERVLRHAVGVLAARPNVVPISVGDADRITVVGDLHGNLVDLLHVLNVHGMPRKGGGGGGGGAGGVGGAGGGGHLLLFNGDFVDRGAYGLEVLLLLAALLFAHPEAVFLGRGNHEDESVNAVYGFKSEVMTKFRREVTPGGSTGLGIATPSTPGTPGHHGHHSTRVGSPEVWNAVKELWLTLPLAHVVNKKVIVLHAMCPLHNIGQSDWSAPTIAELNAVSRRDFVKSTSVDPVFGDPGQFLVKQLLWNDPDTGYAAAEGGGSGGGGGGGGDLWGASSSRTSDGLMRKVRRDPCGAFLRANGLSLLVRSHEAAFAGYMWNYAPSSDGMLSPGPFARQMMGDGHATGGQVCVGPGELGIDGEGESHCCLTLFSTSRYSSAQPNMGAVMTMRPDLSFELCAWGNGATSEAGWWGKGTVDCGEVDSEDDDEGERGAGEVSVNEYVLRHKAELSRELGRADAASADGTTGVVLATEWAATVSRVFSFGDVAYWTSMLSVCVAPAFRDSAVHLDGVGAEADQYRTSGEAFVAWLDGTNVRYVEWLQHTSADHRACGDGGVDAGGGSQQDVLDQLYAHRRHLEAIFRFFDTDHSGTVSADEFARGCAVLADAKGSVLGDTDPSTLFETFDIDGSGEIDLNEFMECFRLVKAQKHSHETKAAPLHATNARQVATPQATSEVA
jgi:hypothetical protein